MIRHWRTFSPYQSFIGQYEQAEERMKFPLVRLASWAILGLAIGAAIALSVVATRAAAYAISP